jgi:zinc transport system permease protein
VEDSFFDVLQAMFSFAFIRRAFIVGALVSMCSSLLGVSLVLKRYSMIGDGLSHVGFGALALATALNASPLFIAIPVVVAAAFLLLRLGEKHLIKGDAAIALISTGSLALGVMIISRTTGMNTDVCNYLFGSILAMSKSDVYLSAVLSVSVLVLFAFFYHKLFAITFDETFARASGVNTGLYNMLTAFLTALTIALGMRMMGAMLISALIIFPALTSMRVFKTFKSVSACAVCVSLVCFFAGIVASYLYAIPAGASVVLANIIVFAVFWIIKSMAKEKTNVKKLCAVCLCAAALMTGCQNKSGSVLNAKKPDAREAASIELIVQPPQAEQNETASSEESPAPPKKQNAGAGKIVEIKEKMFIAQVNDVYLNPEDYLGKTLKLEGLFKRETYGGRDFCFVLRYGPGCCGADGNAGFEVAPASTQKNYPAADDWVEAVGVLQSYEEDGFPFLYLELSSLKKLDKRGAEFVTQ